MYFRPPSPPTLTVLIRRDTRRAGRHVRRERIQAWGVHRRPTYMGSKGYYLVAGQNTIPFPCKRFYFLLTFCKKDNAQDGPRRRRKALGKVITCPEDWMALKRKPRNRALFALWHVGQACKIEAGFGLVSVGK